MGKPGIATWRPELARYCRSSTSGSQDGVHRTEDSEPQLWPLRELAGDLLQAGASRNGFQFAGLLQQHSQVADQCSACRGLDPGDGCCVGMIRDRSTEENIKKRMTTTCQERGGGGIGAEHMVATLLSVACHVTTLSQAKCSCPCGRRPCRAACWPFASLRQPYNA